ncbi:MAG: metal-dependent hydrolase [Bacteroidetes bacterium SW_11_64_17]|nr:MAG: metal-dependent hydrolase [Bacteroidetes bacterium SW_11_64_17]
MDSVTQVTLGAAVGEAVAGKEADNKAPLWGAFFGLLPDLDVLANPFLTEAQSLTFHRSLSHSFVFIAVVTLAAAYGLRRLHPNTPVSKRRWAGLVSAVLLTHVGLDCLTTYGTQVFWPFSDYPVVYGTIFIIDPLYTVPLALGVLVSLYGPATAPARRWANYVGLGLSSAYLLLTVVNKQYISHVFATALEQEAPSYERMFTAPTPFNNLLWQGIAEADDGYYIGFYSLLDDDQSIDFRYVPKRHDLLSDARENPVVQRLRHFSRGYYIVRHTPDGGLQVHDLRFGRSDLGLTSNGQYLFTYRLQKGPDGRIVGMRREEPPLRVTRPLLRKFVARIQGQTEGVPPTPDANSE